jgi:hypothetical protein
VIGQEQDVESESEDECYLNSHPILNHLDDENSALRLRMRPSISLKSDHEEEELFSDTEERNDRHQNMMVVRPSITHKNNFYQASEKWN